MAEEFSKQFLQELNNPRAFEPKLRFQKEANSDFMPVPSY
jgi:hypothetical protein